MSERLTQEDFAQRLTDELGRESELVSLVVRCKGTPIRKEVFRIWGEGGAKKVTVTRFEDKKQTSQETFAASELPARAAALAAEPFAIWEVTGTASELHARRAKKAILVSVGKPPQAREQPKTHDRAREHVLDPKDPETAKLLHALGLASERGHVLPGSERKLRQVEHFVRLALEVLGDTTGDLRLLDAGCGAAYLTFSLHHVLARSGRGRVSMHGVDVREDVIQASEEIAKKLGVEKDVTFTKGLIRDLWLDELPHVVLSLHACDTATDEALAKGVSLGASVILAAPCCQHELHKKLEADALAPLLRHGILRERLADLATDALRATILRAVGYKADVIEFVDPDATAKNLLIRATALRAPKEKRWLEEVGRMKESLGLKEPVALETLLGERLR
ncbi:MAG: SAM-dependent methyltransferase [Planctomycetota bacterium]